MIPDEKGILTIESLTIGRDLMAKVGIQISIVKNYTESSTMISLSKIIEKAYAEINPEEWAAPGKYGKLNKEPHQITLKQPEQVKMEGKNLGYCRTGHELNNLLTGQDAEAPGPFCYGTAEEQQVLITPTTVHHQQYCTKRDSVIHIHETIFELESQGMVSKIHSPFNSPIWLVCKSNGEWRLTADYRGLDEVTPPLSAAVKDMLELQ
ncbi:hypothetical protein DUI87_18698 [Hirundo rustica rustica]|uniref:Reverse transcriptase domain-containing protein n=1 Tax=Hirundo rustica rustica TaxID=333673 RepID=A0A3M0JXH5_HIRRU|nr:hypothetical protein DUI87_18698 [Hirundo rustica rustica]